MPDILTDLQDIMNRERRKFEDRQAGVEFALMDMAYMGTGEVFDGVEDDDEDAVREGSESGIGGKGGGAQRGDGGGGKRGASWQGGWVAQGKKADGGSGGTGISGRSACGELQPVSSAVSTVARGSCGSRSENKPGDAIRKRVSFQTEEALKASGGGACCGGVDYDGNGTGGLQGAEGTGTHTIPISKLQKMIADDEVFRSLEIPVEKRLQGKG